MQLQIVHLSQAAKSFDRCDLIDPLLPYFLFARRMADAEIADAPKQELASNLTLDILQIVKVSQSQHGLRHGDHSRYRQYCTRRLARLYKSLKFSHGRGRYQKKAVEAATVTDERYLLIPLMTAERAWSYAMELKRDAGNEPRKRAHMIRRLKKATVHAAELVVGSEHFFLFLFRPSVLPHLAGLALKLSRRDTPRARGKKPNPFTTNNQ